jgi:hypothetical protein
MLCIDMSFPPPPSWILDAISQRLVCAQAVIGGVCYYVGQTVRGSPVWSVAFQCVSLFAFLNAFRCLCFWHSRISTRLRAEHKRGGVKSSWRLVRWWTKYLAYFGLGAPYVHDRKYFTATLKAIVQFYSVLSIAPTTDRYHYIAFTLSPSSESHFTIVDR